MRASWSAVGGILAWLALSSAPSMAQPQPQADRILLSEGETRAQVSGAIRGYQAIDYKVHLRAGQDLRVTLATPHPATYFNVLEPGQRDAAIHVGSSAGNRYVGAAAASGDYTIRVYMMRSAARRNEIATFKLAAMIAPRGAAGAGAGSQASGKLHCAFARMAPQLCAFRVQRAGEGTASVEVASPRGVRRTIAFERGRALDYVLSPADRRRFSAMRRGDETTVTIGAESYIIPDAVVFGG